MLTKQSLFLFETLIGFLHYLFISWLFNNFPVLLSVILLLSLRFSLLICFPHPAFFPTRSPTKHFFISFYHCLTSIFPTSHFPIFLCLKYPLHPSLSICYHKSFSSLQSTPQYSSCYLFFTPHLSPPTSLLDLFPSLSFFI